MMGILEEKKRKRGEQEMTAAIETRGWKRKVENADERPTRMRPALRDHYPTTLLFSAPSLFSSFFPLSVSHKDAQPSNTLPLPQTSFHFIYLLFFWSPCKLPSVPYKCSPQQTRGWMDGWMGGWMGGWVDKWIGI